MAKLLSVCAVALITQVGSQWLLAGSESMFPPAPEAKPYMDFDGKGFIVNGKRTFLASGSIHYPRVPRALWHDRLLRLKRAGFNTLQTYTFWNYHEPKENQFDFTGEKDFEAYLAEAQKVGLYATVRVGPYVCSEWDSGGYPVWMKFKPNVVVRTDNPAYLALQDHWMEKILPKVAAHQISQGGNVILVQLENEGKHQGAWTGSEAPFDPYFKDIYDQAIKGGLKVPFFMSGYHHGSVPIPESPDNTGRQCPWISTEIWAGWYLNYGSSDYGYMRILRCNEKILARGGNGLNYYMFLGGTNFDSWNDNESSASYDFGAAVGETGNPRPVYYREKANNLFAVSFSDILENSSDATEEYQDFASNGRVIGARKSPAGTVVFVQGKVANTDPAVIKSVGSGNGGSIHIGALEVCHVVLDAPIVSGSTKIAIVQGITNIMGIARQGKTTTLIVYGEPGDTGVITLALGDKIKKVEVSYPTTLPAETIETAGDQTLRILSMSRQLSDCTWIAGQPGNEYVVVGPEYLGDFSMENGQPSMTIERPYTRPAPSKVVVYGAAAAPVQHLEVKADLSIDTVPAPKLDAWQISVPPESNPEFDDSGWKASEDPSEMGMDGDNSAFAWYRASVQMPQAGSGILKFAGAADHLIVFINGKRVAATPSILNPKPTSAELKTGDLSWTVPGDFVAGRNSVAVLATHQGRDKAGGYWGPIKHYYPKGIFKPVEVEMAGKKIAVKGWKLRGGLPIPSSYQALVDLKSPAFFQTTFTAQSSRVGPNPILRFDTATLSRGTIFLNGHCLGRYPSTLKDDRKPLGMYLPECWFAPDGKNTLVVFEEEGRSPAQAQIQVEMAASREVIAVSKPTDSQSPIQLPPFKPVDLRKDAQLNTATDRPVTVSSSLPDHEAANANDADGQSTWMPASPPTEDKPVWLQIDLQQPRHLVSCEIFWKAGKPSNPYLVEGSSDGKKWRLLVDKRKLQEAKDGGGRSFDQVPDGANTRYLRATIFHGFDPKKPTGIDEIRAWDVPHN